MFFRPNRLFLHFFRRNFQITTDDAKRFKFYCYFVAGVLSLLVFNIIILSNFRASRYYVDYIFLFYFCSFILTGVVDVICIVMAGIKVFQLFDDSIMSENTRFVMEKERFEYTHIFVFQFF